MKPKFLFDIISFLFFISLLLIGYINKVEWLEIGSGIFTGLFLARLGQYGKINSK